MTNHMVSIHRPVPLPRSDLPSLFAALANTDRLAIIRELRMRDALVAGDSESLGVSIDETAQLTELSRFSASRHLAILRDVGLVRATVVGNQKRHALDVGRLELVEDWLYQLTDGFTPTIDHGDQREGSAVS